MRAAVIGIDVSLASTGVAVHHHDGRIVHDTILSRGKRGDDLPQRRKRLRAIRECVRDHLVPGDLIVVEGPAGATPGGSTWDRAGLWWGIVDLALDYGPVAIVGPTTRIKWATGSGRSDKAAVAASMARRAPDIVVANSDEADALALAWMGAQYLGWRSATAAERISLNVVRWPDTPAAN